MVRDFYHIVFEGLGMLSVTKFVFVITSALVFAAVCWWGCVNYTRLWNKRYRSTIAHHLLCAISSALTLLLILTFVGMKRLKPVSAKLIVQWAEGLQESQRWNDFVFEKAYYTLKQSGRENFADVPDPKEENSYLPFSDAESMVLAAQVYADEACRNFEYKHAFLSRILSAKPSVSSALIQSDMTQFFEKEADLYPMNRAVRLAAGQILKEMVLQLPRVLRIARLSIVFIFCLFQLIPLGVIGYCAYQDLKLNKYQLT
ncbi:hypothetical protein BC643_1831 [Mangrovibacterium diazotrophicum]|uniref:Uncharacterized protein n=2 Tax=Mangrovibacterium diazotrophicum TaxID=1261403 RepID=A0A419W7Q6_9BACT|nr:hypothetical protein BC643_1831 [Mangrovibacterium diazotrophicum]